MKFRYYFAILLAIALLPSGISAQSEIGPSLTTESTRRFAVVYQEGASSAVQSQAHQARRGFGLLSASADQSSQVHELEHVGIGIIEVSESAYEETMRRYALDPYVAYVEEEAFYHLTATPTDPNFSFQWGMRDHTDGIDTRFTDVWNFATGTTSTVIGVLDSGIAYNHPDLDDNLWDGTNCNNTASSGTPCTLYGWDFVNGDNDPVDDQAHGTHVSGIIAAEGNNGVGVAGANWVAQIASLKVANAAGQVSNIGVIYAIDFAIANNIRVLNMSFGGNGYLASWDTAFGRYSEFGGVVVAAAGNNVLNNDTLPFYPCDHAYDNIICVGAVQESGGLSGSNFGTSSVDIGAPGVSIYSTYLTGTSTSNNYAYLSGTSMATPHVAGAIGLILSRHPNASSTSIRNAILVGATSSASLATTVSSSRYLDAYTPLLLLNSAPTATADVVSVSTTILTPTSSYNVFANDTDAEGDSFTIISATSTTGTVSIINSSTGDLYLTATGTVSDFPLVVTTTYVIEDILGATSTADAVVTFSLSAFSFVSSSPIFGTTSTPTSTVVELTFDTALDESSITTSTVGIKSSTSTDSDPAVDANVTLINNSTTIRITPTSYLDTVTDYYVFVSSSVSSTFGQIFDEGSWAYSNSSSHSFQTEYIGYPPVVDATSTTTSEDIVVSIFVSSTDANPSDSFSYTVTSTLGSVTGTYPNLTYTPNSNATGTDIVEIGVNDGTYVVTSTITIVITDVNDAPVISLSAGNTPSIEESSPLSFMVTSTDVEDGTLYVVTTSSLPSGASYTTSTGVFSWTPDTSQAGTYTIEWYAVDSSSVTTTTSTVITVTDLDVNSGSSSGGGGGGGGGGSSVRAPLLSSTTISFLRETLSIVSGTIDVILSAVGGEIRDYRLTETQYQANAAWTQFSTSTVTWSFATPTESITLWLTARDLYRTSADQVSATFYLDPADEPAATPALVSVTTTAISPEQFVNQPILPCALTANQAYTYAGTQAVYYVTPSCTKRAFTRPDIFFTYFTSWSEAAVTSASLINSIPDDALGFMPLGPLWDPQFGAIVKYPQDPKVYLILGDTRYWIESETVFLALYGQQGWSWIEDVDPRLLVNYNEGTVIDYTDHHPNFTIVKYADSPRVYRLEPDPADSTRQVKRHIANETVFASLRFRDDRIVVLSASEVYADGADIFSESDLGR